MTSTGLQSKAADFANIFKAFIGTNYLSLPYGFYLSGIGLGLVGLFIVALFTDYSCILMVRCKYLLIDSLCHEYAEDNSGSSKTKLEQKLSTLRSRLMLHLDYGDLVCLTFGKWGLYLVNFCIIVTQVGFCTNYFIVIGNLLETLLPVQEFNVSIPWLPTNSSYITGILNASVETDILTEEFHQIRTLEEEKGDLISNGSIINPQDEFNTVVIAEQSSLPLPLLVIAPLPILILCTYFRNVRQLGTLSIFATTCVCIAFVGALGYLAADFELSSDISWWIPSGFLVYIGQATGAFEAVALILPIEASMVGNWAFFPMFLHATVTLITAIILIMAIMGYLSFGADTQQIILQNFTRGEPMTIVINSLVIMTVICTYPMQIVPVIQILENALFGEKTPPKDVLATDLPSPSPTSNKETTPLMSSSLTASTIDEQALESLQLSAAYHVPKSVATWKRNLCRTLVTIGICGLAILLRNVLAYTLAFVGALGSCPLAYIIPSVLYMKLHSQEIKRYEVIMNCGIIGFGCVCSLVGIILSFKNIIYNA